MAVRPSDDPLDCFSSLADVVPQWLTRVSDLAQHTAARHAEFSAEYVKLTALGNSRVLPQRRRKTSSLNTAPVEEEQATAAVADADTNANPNPDNTSSSHLASDDPFRDPLTLLRLSRTQPQDLKRKHPDTSPSRSKPGSKPHTRVRHAVIVHYDSHTQQTLEMLVRDFGGARNKMRKGRMQHMMKTGFGFKSGFATGRNAGRDDDELNKMRPMFRSSRLDPSKNVNRTKEVSPFDTVDKHLESAQSLCEVSAHQFLRHGDCSTELEKTKERLELVLATARSEAQRLQAEAAAEAEKEKAKAKRRSMTEDQKRPKPDRRVAKPDQIPLHGLDDHIEVDDGSDSSSVSIDIKAFRRSRQR